MADIRIVPSAGAINVTGSADFRGTGGSTILYLTGSGQIGAGTTNPDSEFHIVGSGTRFVTLDRSGTRSYDLGVNSSGTFLVTDNTATADRISLSVSGSVGIGTTGPLSLLHLRGSEPAIRIVDTDDSSTSLIGSTSGYTFIRPFSRDFRVINDAGTGLLTVKTGGNVGIGTTNPATKLNVVGGRTYLEGANEIYTLGISRTGANAYYLGVTNASSPDLYFSNNAGTTHVTFTDTGRVGIGTTNPVQALHVVGNIYQRTGDVITWSNGDAQIGAVSGYNLAFSTYDGVSAMVERMRVTSAGLVGIGTTNPSGQFEAYSSVYQRVVVSYPSTYVTKLTIGGNAFIQQDAGNEVLTIEQGYGGGDIAFNAGGSTQRMLIRDTGAIRLNNYGSGTFTGTAAKALAVDSSGNVIEVNNAALDGSGTANYVTKWSDSDSLTNSVMYDDGTNIGIGLTTPGAPLHVFKTATYSAIISRADWNSGTETRLGIGKQYGVLGYISTDLVETTNDTSYIALNYKSGLSSYAEGLRVYNTGNVGIGVTNPSQKLEVTGNIYATGYVQGGSAYISDQSGISSFGSNSATRSIRIGRDGTYNDLLISGSNGYVGIGVSNPTDRLAVDGNISIFSSYKIYNGSAADSAGISFPGNVTRIDGYSGITFNSSTTNVGSQTERMRITNDGNVGIGLTNPSYALHVNGGAASRSDVQVTYNALGTTNADGAQFGIQSAGAYIWNFENSPIYFGTNNSRKVDIDANGNVGIGTASPGYKLHVSGGSEYIEGGFGTNTATAYTATNRLIFNNDYSDTARGPNKITLYDASWLGGFGIHNDTLAYYTGGTHKWYQATSATNAVHLMTLNSSGNLGINTTSPGYKLDVVGDARITSDLTVSGKITAREFHTTFVSASIIYQSGSTQFGNSSDDTHVFTGCIGVGTTPRTALTLNQDNVSYAGQLQIAASDYAQITFYNSAALTPGASNRKASLIYNIPNNRFEIANQITTGSLILQGSDSGGGNVGIGTDSPVAKVDINGATVIRSRLTVNKSTDETYGALNVWDTTSGTGASRIADFTNGTDNNLNFYVSQVGATTKFSEIASYSTIPLVLNSTSGGNVGIGNKAPNQKLELSVGNGVTGGLRINYAAAATSEGMDITYLNNGATTTSFDSRYSSDSAVMQFRMKTAGTAVNAMTILGSGFVGIGTTNPGGKLTIGTPSSYDGTILRLQSTGEPDAYNFYVNETVTSGVVRWVFNMTNNSSYTNMMVFDRGNVGIGTTNPATNLQVNGTFASNALWTDGSSIGYWGAYSTAYGGLTWDTGQATVFATGGNKLHLGSNGSSADMTIDLSGNILMGDTISKPAASASPARLTLRKFTSGNATTAISGSYYLGVGGNEYTANSYRLIGFGYAENNTQTTYPSYIGYQEISTAGYTYGDLIFGTRATTGATDDPTERMRITYAGNVGVGTTNPGYRLDVDAGSALETARFYNSSNAATVVRVGDSGNSDYSDLLLQTNSGTGEIFKAGTGYTSYGGALALNIYNSNGPIAFHPNNTANVMTIANTGNVGIGSTSPGAKLHVKQTGIADNTATTLLLLDGQFQDASIEGADMVSIGFRVENSTGGSQSSQAISFAYDNTLSLMKDGGTVGVGTTSATNRLTVYQGGGVRVTGITSGDWIEISGNLPGYTDNQYPVIKSNGTIHFANSNKYSAYLEGSDTYFGILNSSTVTKVFLATSGNTYFTGGNVGIGTTSPASILNTSGANNGITHDDSTTGKGYIRFRNGGTQLSLFGIAGAWEGSSLQDTMVAAETGLGIRFYTNGSGTAKMVVTSAGLVGIGTTAPINGSKFEVRGSGIWDGGVITLTNTGTSGRSWSIFSTNSSFDQGAGKLLVYNTTAGTNAMVIDSSDNVGIGTTNPAVKLVVADGVIRATGTTGATGQIDASPSFGAFRFYDGSTFYGGLGMGQWAGVGANADIVQYLSTGVNYHVSNTTTPVLTVSSGGNVGIGITNPGYKLQIQGTTAGFSAIGAGDNVRTGVAHYDTTAQAAGIGGQLVLGYKYTDAGDFTEGAIIKMYKENSVSGEYGSGIKFQVRNHGNNLSTKVVINPSGNVGIGTTDPGYPLHVYLNSNSGLLSTIRNVSTGTAQYVEFKIGQGDSRELRIGSSYNYSSAEWNQNWIYSVDRNLALKTDNGYAIRFYTDGTGDANERMRVASGGNVGIGTTSPGTALHIARTAAVAPVIRLHTTDSTTNGAVQWVNSAGNQLALIGSNYNIGDSSGNLEFATGGGSTRMVIRSGGNIGIGTSNPTTLLDVAGGINTRNSRTNTGEKVPLGHYTPGETVFEIDPTWTQAQLQDYFNSSGVTWAADSTAPGGYAIQIDGAVNVAAGAYGSGFPYIPVDSSQDDWFYMECWIRNEAGSVNNHYMGGIDYDHTLSSLGGNPGSFTYNVMLNYSPGTSWTKVFGYWNGFGNSSGGSGTGNTNNWEAGTKYFTPQALFNYSNSSGTRRCYISGWKCVRVRATGNRYYSDNVLVGGSVGIGVTNPINKLEVRNGGSSPGYSGNDVVFSNSYGKSAFYHDNGGYVYWYSDLAITFYPGASRSVTFSTGGNVGIGATNPDRWLTVSRSGAANGTQQQVALFANTATGATSAAIYIGAYTGTDWLIGKNIYGVSSLTNFQIGDQGVASSYLDIVTGGSIGIGTSAPTTKLNVLIGAGGTNGTVGLKIGGPSNYDSLELGIEGDYNGQIRTYGNDLHLYAGHWRSVGNTATEDHAIRFFTSKTSSTNWSTAKMILTADGNVGIGSNSPGWKLDVAGNARIGDNTSQQTHAALQVSAGQGSASTYRDIDLKGNWAGGEGHAITAIHGTTSNNIVGQIVFEHNSPGSRIKFGRLYDSGDSGTYPFHMVSAGTDGRLGIGTSSPAYALDVTGTIRATGDVIAYSDARVKENVLTLENSLELVKKLRGVSYNKIGESEKKVGVIAQEVLEVLPEVVSQDQEGTYSVAYGNITAVLIEAIKQQQLQIDELKAEIKQLKG